MKTNRHGWKKKNGCLVWLTEDMENIYQDNKILISAFIYDLFADRSSANGGYHLHVMSLT